MSKSQITGSGQRVGQVARAMLDGTLHYLEGAIELEQLRHDVGAYENDPDFIVFVAVKMEVEDLTKNESLDTMTKSQSESVLKELNASVEWAKAISLEQCRTLANRYPMNIDT